MIGSFRGYSEGGLSGLLRVFFAAGKTVEFLCIEVLVRPVAGPNSLKRVVSFGGWVKTSVEFCSRIVSFRCFSGSHQKMMTDKSVKVD
jgi:hypothetical protein